MFGDELSAVDRVSLGLSRSYYAAFRVLRLNKLRDLLASGASITPDAPVWLLGSCYSCAPGASEAQQEEVSDPSRASVRCQAALQLTPNTVAAPALLACPLLHRPWLACCTISKAFRG